MDLAIFISSKSEIVAGEFFGRLVACFWSLCSAFMINVYRDTRYNTTAILRHSLLRLRVQPESITEQFGPHLSRSTGRRLDPGVVPDKVVDTHCCFCGQQCGIHLLVKDNQVIGYEPWYEFPFNKGKLCPKGVKRYLQGAHPDRLLHAYKRDLGNPHGFSAIPYEEAIRKVAEEIGRIQNTYGPSAFASLSGASLTKARQLKTPTPSTR